MGLVGPHLNITSTKKRFTKTTKAQQEELERRWRDRNQTLKSMSLPKETFDQFVDFIYGRVKKEKASSTTFQAGYKKPVTKKSTKISPVVLASKVQRDFGPRFPSFDSGSTGACSSKPSPVYTGEKIIGISQMAKSNAVPVFNQEAIVDIARMRR